VSDLVFIDTETTGLKLHDHIWEFAAIRRFADGTESVTHIHIDHDPDKTNGLPEKYRNDILARFGVGQHIYTPAGAASIIHAALYGQPHLVGANIAFDAGMIERLLDAHGLEAPWHYHLLDVETLTVGMLADMGRSVERPWRSDDLAELISVDQTDDDGNPRFERHTALGDAHWVRTWWDQLMANTKEGSK
jgi:hypothetical protein